MRVIKLKALQEFGKRHPQSWGSLEHWYHLIRKEKFENTSDIKAVFGSGVDFVANNGAIFNIKGNDYRLIAEINYHRQSVFIRFLGTHSEYDKIDPNAVTNY